MNPEERVLEAVRAYRPPKTLQPISMKLFDLYEAGGSRFTDDAIREIEEDVRSLHGDLKALTDLLYGLGTFVVFAEERLHDKYAASQIVEIMKATRHEYVPLVEFLSNLHQDASKKALTQFDGFSGRDQEGKSRAPVLGVRAPGGTVSLKDLRPSEPIPPHVRRALRK